MWTVRGLLAFFQCLLIVFLIMIPYSLKTPVVVLMSRAHAGESPTSFVIQGLIDFLVSQHDIARELRDYVVFKVLYRNNNVGSTRKK